MKRDDEGHWFAGGQCGTGAVISWQGWFVGSVYALVIWAAVLLLAERTMVGLAAVVIVATALLIVLLNHKTRGGIRWRSQASEPRRRSRTR
jgi:hypothetical protein